MSVRVLLADDHGIVREGLRLLLNAQSDIDVVGEASNGFDAVQAALKLRPDIAIIDIAMPGLNGIEAARQIHEELPEVQTIMLSMYVSNEYIYRALESGARGYVLKEAVGEELIQAVHTVNNGGRHLSPRISDDLIDAYLQQRATVAKDAPLSLLSAREREILPLVAEGCSSVEIGELLSLSSKTVETYRSRLMQKLELESLADLIKFALRHELISIE